VKAAPFAYVAPRTVEACVSALAEHGDEAKLLAGGQSLVPMIVLRLARPEALIDVNRVDGLSGVRRDGDHLVIGATTRHAEIGADPQIAEHVPLLTRVAPYIGHFQIRNRGTLGGSLAHADPAAEWPVAALALDAEIEIVGPQGERREAAADFFETIFTTTLQADELITAVRFPIWGSGSGFAVEEVARRHGDFAIAGALVAVQVDDGRLVKAAIGLVGMGLVPIRAGRAEAELDGVAIDDLDLEAVGHQAVADIEAPTDIHADGAYRLAVGASLVTRALGRALEDATHA
jgi:carbon-monoxide dehydrogenase medium subunit